MIGLITGVLARILSNSFIGVGQKLLTENGEKPAVINFYSYLGLTFIGLFIAGNILVTKELILYISIMGLFGALGNYYIIKALSCGELSALSPINAYKPVVALFIACILIKEYPNIYEVFGIILILSGTLILSRSSAIFNKAGLYRFMALLFSGSEAVIIKKVIILSDVNTAFFFWAFSGLIFSLLFALKYGFKLKFVNLKYQLSLIFLTAIMQYSTNYVFSKISTAASLALFQLSTLLSIILGVKIFQECKILHKLISAIIMLIGAVFVIFHIP